MDKGTWAVFQKDKLALALLLILYLSGQSFANQCGDFLKTQTPGIQGRLISVSVFDMHRDQNGLLGGVHYTESLAASYGLPQVGVRYESNSLQILVEDYLTGQILESGKSVRLTGELIDDRGEPILMVTRLIKADEWAVSEEQSGESGAQVLEFRR